MSSFMPQGIGPIGIYHSHPFSSEIFHSHTDDATLTSLSNQFPNCVSIVTNGKEINYYQMGKSSTQKEVQAKFIEPKIPKFLLIAVNEIFCLKFKKEALLNNPKIKILNKIRNFFENAWNEIDLYFKNSLISKNDYIKEYLVNNLNAEPIQFKIDTKFKKNGKVLLIIDKESNSNKEVDNNQEYEILELIIKVNIPIYISKENQTFNDLDQYIKAELISNNILQKIYNCEFDSKVNRIIIPFDYYINFFGFFIRLLYFKNQTLFSNNISFKNYKFIQNLLTSFNSFQNIELLEDKEDEIRFFVNDIINYSKKYKWYNILKKRLNLIKKKFTPK